MRLLPYLLFFLVSTPAFSQHADSSRILRVLTYNIYHGETMKGDFDLDLIASVIRSSSPGLVALQEVDLRTNRAQQMDLALELAQRTGMIPLFGRAMPFDGGEYGVAILSKYSFIRSRNLPLPASPGHEPRTALEVTMELPSGDTICFVSTHLDHTEDPSNRIQQAEALNRYLAGNAHPTILAGDLNARPDSEPMQLLFSHWQPSWQDAPAPTFPSDNPVKKIDYLLYSPSGAWEVLETRVACDEVASDHCACLAVVSY